MNKHQDTPFCPYKGLQPFTTDDREYFFGREDETQIVTSNLKVAPLTVLYGASGVGKTSVLMAGVVTRLQEEKEAAAIYFRDWQNAGFISGLRKETLGAISRITGTELQVDESQSFVDFVVECTKFFPGQLLFIFDQFEEYFLYHGPKGSQENNAESNLDFDVDLARAVNRRDLRANFLLSLREDGLSKLDRLQTRIPNLLGNLVRLEHLSMPAARAAVRKPLDVYNRKRPSEPPVKVEPQLVEKLLNQVQAGEGVISGSVTGDTRIHPDGSGQIETSFLQLVLERLWNAESKRWEAEEDVDVHRLTVATLDELGGAKHIVRTHLDEVMARLGELAHEEAISISSEEALAMAAEIFRFLVTQSETKIAHTANDLASFAELPDSRRKHLEEVLELLALRNVRILRKVEPPPGKTGGVRYEIYHDVLGPAILDWRARYMQRVAEQDAAEKLEQHRLAAERTAAEARSKLAQAQAVAEAERQRAQAEQRRAQAEVMAARRFRWATLALAILFILALVATTYAFVVRNQAVRAKGEAEQAKAAALLAQESEATQRLRAEENAKEANAAEANAVKAQADKEAQRARAEQKAVEAELAKGIAIAARKSEADQRQLAVDKANEALAATARAEEQARLAKERADDAERQRTVAENVRKAFHLSRRKDSKEEAISLFEGAFAVYSKSNQPADQLAAVETLLNIGEVYADLGNLTEASKSFNQARGALRDDDTRARILTRIGDIYLDLNTWTPGLGVDAKDAAIQNYEEARGLYRNPADKASVLISLGLAKYELAYRGLGPRDSGEGRDLVRKNVDEAFGNLQEAVDLFRSAKDHKGQGFALLKLAETRLREQGPPTPEGNRALIPILEEALTEYKTAGDLKGEIPVLRRLVSLESSDPQKAFDRLTDVAVVYDKLHDFAGEASTMIDKSFLLRAVEKDPQRLNLGIRSLQREAADLYAKAGSLDKAAETLMSLSNSYFYPDFDAAAVAAILEEAAQLYGRAGRLQQQAAVLSTAAGLLITADRNKASGYVDQILRISEQADIKPIDKAQVLFYVGAGYLSLRDAEKGAGYFAQAVSVADQLNKSLEAYIFQQVSNAYLQQRLPDQAIAYLNRMLQLVRTIGDSYREGYALIALGRAYTLKGQIPVAIGSYEQAARFFKEKKDASGEGDAQIQIGVLYEQQQLHDQAIGSLTKAVALFQQAGNPYGQGDALFKLAAAYAIKRESQKAIDSYSQAVQLFHARKMTYDESRALVEISKIYRSLGDIKNAEDYQQRADSLAPPPAVTKGALN